MTSQSDLRFAAQNEWVGRPPVVLARSHPLSQVLIFLSILATLILLHAPLLRLPYIWDEAGYYVPAARDVWLMGSLVPHSTLSNAHPPLVMLWLALAWKLAGFTPLVSRIAMLFVAAFTLLGVYRLALAVANRQVAMAATLCTGLYPVVFMQSSMVHLDMAAAGLTIWGMQSYVQRRKIATALWFALAGLAKETAIIAPLTLLLWELIASPYLASRGAISNFRQRAGGWLLIPLIPLALWFGYHYWRTGEVFGNPEYFRYNVAATLHPVRIVIAAGLRLWQLLGYLHLWFLTVATLLAMFLPPLPEGVGTRKRIAVALQLTFAGLVVAYVVAMAVIGGAVLARYMLPVLPLIMIVFVSTLWRRVHYWQAVIGFVAVMFVAGWFLNPPYGFSFEDNLAYRDYILLHQHAERILEEKHASAQVLTAWPASDELTRSYLGYVKTPVQVLRIDDFSLEQIASAAESRQRFDAVLAFSTKYTPPHPVLRNWPAWERLKQEYFGFHRDLPPTAIAQLLAGEVVYSAARNGQWIAIIAVAHPEEAALRVNPPAGGRNRSLR